MNKKPKTAPTENVLKSILFFAVIVFRKELWYGI